MLVSNYKFFSNLLIYYVHRSIEQPVLCIFGTKHGIDNRSSALQTIYKESPTSSENDINFGRQTA